MSVDERYYALQALDPETTEYNVWMAAAHALELAEGDRQILMAVQLLYNMIVKTSREPYNASTKRVMRELIRKYMYLKTLTDEHDTNCFPVPADARSVEEMNEVVAYIWNWLDEVDKAEKDRIEHEVRSRRFSSTPGSASPRLESPYVSPYIPAPYDIFEEARN